MKKLCLAAIFAVVVISQSYARFPHGYQPSTVGQVVVNVNGSPLSFLNLAHSLTNGAASQAGWPAALTVNGYPTNALTQAISSNSLTLVPNYYGHYKTWWSGTGAIQLSPAAIIYNGGTSTTINSNNGSVAFNLGIGFGAATTQPTSSIPVEWAPGALINGISDAGSCSGGIAGLVCLTSNLSSAFANISTGTLVQVNNVTNLLSGPWTLTKLDNQHIQLQGSVFNGAMAVVSGAPGTQSEVIFSTSSATWTFFASPTVNYSGFDAMVICRSQNVGIGGLSDCTNVGAHYVNPDYVTAFKAPNLNPRFIRFMDQTAVQSNFSTSFSTRPTTTQLPWSVNHVSGNWVGLLTNTSDVFLSASNPTNSPTSGPPVDGEMVEGYIGATSTTMVPTLIINRSSFGSAKPILGSTVAGLSLNMTGSVPSTATTISFVFTGGGLPTPFTYNYLTSTTVNGPGGVLDTSFSNISANIRADINNNTRGNAGVLVTAHIISENPEVGSFMTFGYNPNINSSGAASLGNGLTITGSDSASSGVYTFGFVSVGFLPINHNFSFTYSSIAGGWIAQDGGGSSTFGLSGALSGPPLEFYEDFVNLANVGMWLNIPVLYSDVSVYNAVLHIANAGVKELTLEISNETWNTGPGGQWHIFNSMGQMLGLPSTFTGGPAVDAYTGLRIIQIGIQARSAWAAAGRNPNNLFIADAFQFVAASGAVSNRFNGSALNPSSNVTLAAYGGAPSNGTMTPGAVSTNYSTFPNRPVDWSDFVSGAPYSVGVQFNSVGNSQGSGLTTSGVTVSAYNCSLISSYNYVNGNSTQQQAALDFMFNGTSGDFYTLTGLGGGTINIAFDMAAWAHGSGTGGADYFGITSIVSAYDAVRTGTNPHTGVAWNLLGAAEYEGDEQAGPIFSTDIINVTNALTTLGDSAGYTTSAATCSGMAVASGSASTVAGDAGNMAALLAAFKADNRYKLLYQRYFSDFISAVNSQGTRIALPATYGFESGKQPWAKYPLSTIYSTPYGSWNAIQVQDN